jgi:hypothetical protein
MSPCPGELTRLLMSTGGFTMSNTASDTKSIPTRVTRASFRAQTSGSSVFSGDPGSFDFEEPEAAITESRSSSRTRAALLALDECSTDTRALRTLWEENHLAFESQMERHLDSPDSPALRKRVLSAVASVCRFYCAEIDEPKAWVARCANLETRRVALQLRK